MASAGFGELSRSGGGIAGAAAGLAEEPAVGSDQRVFQGTRSGDEQAVGWIGMKVSGQLVGGGADFRVDPGGAAVEMPGAVVEPCVGALAQFDPLLEIELRQLEGGYNGKGNGCFAVLQQTECFGAKLFRIDPEPEKHMGIQQVGHLYQGFPVVAAAWIDNIAGDPGIPGAVSGCPVAASRFTGRHDACEGLAPLGHDDLFAVVRHFIQYAYALRFKLRYQKCFHALNMVEKLDYVKRPQGEWDGNRLNKALCEINTWTRRLIQCTAQFLFN